MENSRTTFGQYIAWARDQSGLTLREMAALVIKEDGQPISNQYLSDIENDRRNPPSDHLIEEIARVLKRRVPEVSAEVLYLKARRVPPDIDAGRVNGQQARAAINAMRRKIRHSSVAPL